MICILATCRSSGVAAWSTSTKPCNVCHYQILTILVRRTFIQISHKNGVCDYDAQTNFFTTKITICTIQLLSLHNSYDEDKNILIYIISSNYNTNKVSTVSATATTITTMTTTTTTTTTSTTITSMMTTTTLQFLSIKNCQAPC